MLNIPISSIVFLANEPEDVDQRGFDAEVFQVESPKKMEICQAVVEDPCLFRSNKHLIVVDFGRSTVYCSRSLRVNSSPIVDYKEKTQGFENIDDKWLMLRLLRKALDIEVRKRTGLERDFTVLLVS